MKLNGPLVAGGNVRRFQISPYSTHVTYVADEHQDGVDALFAVPIQGGPRVTLSAGMPGRYIYEQAITPDRTRMVYLADHDTAGDLDLYCVPLDGSQAAQNLSAMIPMGRASFGFVMTPDSAQVVFEFLSPGHREIYSARLDGSTPPVRIGMESSEGGVQSGFQLTPLGDRVVFLTYLPANLYSTPVDGSSAPLQLNSPAGHGTDVSSFVLNGTGTRVLYRAKHGIDAQLFSAHVDGHLPPSVRSDDRTNLATIGDVGAFQLTPDGQTAVYWASTAANGSDLYAVNLAGEPVSVALDAAPLENWLVSPDSRRVIVRTTDTVWTKLLDGTSEAAVIGAHPGEPLRTPARSPTSSRRRGKGTYSAWRSGPAHRRSTAWGRCSARKKRVCRSTRARNGRCARTRTSCSPRRSWAIIPRSRSVFRALTSSGPERARSST